jgi:hypothetical protein
MAALSRMDPGLELLAHAAHGECSFKFFEIGKVEVARAIRSRDASGMHQATLDEDQGRPLVMLTLTSDF